MFIREPTVLENLIFICNTGETGVATSSSYEGATRTPPFNLIKNYYYYYYYYYYYSKRRLTHRNKCVRHVFGLTFDL